MVLLEACYAGAGRPDLVFRHQRPAAAGAPARQPEARDGDDLAPVDAEVPVELAPVVSAFDDLLAKLQAGARAQHDFLANVAHQLRTPLAGVKLQLEWLGARHAGDADSVHSIRLMLLSNERMIRQTNQLLALARAEPSHFEKTRLEPLDLAALVARVDPAFRRPGRQEGHRPRLRAGAGCGSPATASCCAT